VLAFDARGRLLAHDIHGLRVWPAGPQAMRVVPDSRSLPPAQSMFNWAPIAIARTPDGRTAALLRVNSVYLWRSEAPDRLVPVVAPRPADIPENEGVPTLFRAVQIAPFGDRLYLLDWSGRLKIWDLHPVAGGSEVRAVASERRLPPLDGIFSFALREDGSILAVGDRTGVVTLIDTTRLTAAGSITPPADESGGFSPTLAFSGDGRTLAVSTQQGMIALYTVESPGRPRLRLRLPGHRGRVAHLAFDAPGDRLASASWNDPVVEVWDLALIRRDLQRLGLGE
jgi:WD40 repeat protein